MQNLAPLSLFDQRGFDKSSFGKDRYRIAWISGSEGEYFPPGKNSDYVANLVTKALPQIAGRPVGVDLYFLPAMRQADLYFALLDAIASKPDMIVMSLNPVWVLDPIATHEWTQLDAKAATQLIDRPAGWPIAASLLSPSDLMWGLAADAFETVPRPCVLQHQDPGRRRTTSAPSTARGWPWPRRANRARTTRHSVPSASGSSTGSTSPTAPVPRTGPRGSRSPTRETTRSTRCSSARPREALRDSKIPSYVYLAQVNSQWLATNPPIRKAVSGVEQQLADVRSDFSAGNIRFQPLNASRFVPGLVFQRGDVIHIQQPAAIGPYLADQLCRLARQTGQTGCNPTRKVTADG